MERKSERPTEGGSYVVDKDGSRRRVAFTQDAAAPATAPAGSGSSSAGETPRGEGNSAAEPQPAPRRNSSKKGS